jgi:predicted nucleic acid-binding protein
MKMTVDASVFVASVRLQEANYQISLDFLQEIRSRGDVELICPSLVLPECSAAVMRRQQNATSAATLVRRIAAWPNSRFPSLTKTRARQASQLAAQLRLRGADSVYVATAKEFNTTLITWDEEVLQRSAAAVRGMTPEDWLRTQPSSTNHPT